MNIHLPAILMFTRGTRFWPIPIPIYIYTHHFWKATLSVLLAAAQTRLGNEAVYEDLQDIVDIEDQEHHRGIACA